MGIEVNNGEIGKAISESSQDRIRDGVIATEADWSLAQIEQRSDRAFDRRECPISRQIKIARVQDRFCVKFDPAFGG